MTARDKRVESMQIGVDVVDALRAEVERLRVENAELLWNLGGCSTYAMGWGLDTDPSGEKVRPALTDVLKLARRERDHRAEVERLRNLLWRVYARWSSDNTIYDDIRAAIGEVE